MPDFNTVSFVIVILVLISGVISVCCCLIYLFHFDKYICRRNNDNHRNSFLISPLLSTGKFVRQLILGA